MSFYVDLRNKDVQKVVNRSIKAGSGAHGDCSFSIFWPDIAFYWTPHGSTSRVEIARVKIPVLAGDVLANETDRKLFVLEEWLDVVAAGVAAMLSVMTGALRANKDHDAAECAKGGE